jgi:hypothetical protein
MLGRWYDVNPEVRPGWSIWLSLIVVFTLAGNISGSVRFTVDAANGGNLILMANCTMKGPGSS